MSSALEKTTARLMAVQALYSIDVSGDENPEIDELVENIISLAIKKDRADKKFFKKITEGVLAEKEKIDEKISALLDKDWNMERMSPVLKSALRAGCWEINYEKTPPKIVISEYVKIAGSFFGDSKETGFVNAILDKIVKQGN